MSAPATPVIQGAKATYKPTSQVSLSWTTGYSVTSSTVDVYADGAHVSTQSATGAPMNYGILWTWSATASTLGGNGSTITVQATVTNVDGTSAPASVTFTVNDAPSVTLTPAQGATVTGLPLVVSWAVDDPSGVSRQVLRIYNGQSVVYATDYTPALALDPAERSRTLFASDLLTPFESGETYNVRITVTNGVSLSTTVTHAVGVSWTAPTPPTLTGTEPDPATASVVVRATAPLCDIVVWRVIGGARVVVAEGNASVEDVDELAPLGVDVTYEAVATDAQTGTVSEVQTRIVRAESWAWAFNFGADAAEVVQIDGNPRASWSIDQGGELYHFADGGAGGGLPVWYGTTDRDEGGTVSFATVGPSTTDRLRDLCTAHPMGWIRDPFGRRWYAHMRPKFDYQGGNLWNVTISWDAARFVEV